MSPFTVDEQFPTFKRIAAAYPPRRLAGIFIIAPLRWTGRFIRKTYKYTLALILVLALADVIASLILGHMLRDDIAAMKAKGFPVSAADLAGPRIPDKENGAVVYAQAFKLISTPQADKDLDVISRFLSREEREKDPSLWSQAGAIMPRYRKALDLATEAASRPKCHFPVQWERGLEVLFPHYAKARRMAQLARADAMLSAKAGRTDDAIRSVELGFKISDSLKDEPVLTTYLVRVAIAAISARSAEDLLEYADISEPQSKDLFDHLARIEMGSGAVYAVRTETVIGLWEFDQVHAGRYPIYVFTSDG